MTPFEDIILAGHEFFAFLALAVERFSAELSRAIQLNSIVDPFNLHGQCRAQLKLS